jgi:GalNAc-alpha-(1->4)-GalNAc-alpha-(1->3)-diNAcBac-PP-undecaprenol alpha-1,4-N-acetyl-D-galactosaminyltransferase
MRATCVVSSLGPGGAERAAVVLAAHLTGRGDDVTILVLRDDVPDFHEAPDGVDRVTAEPAAAVDVPWWHAPGVLRRGQALRRVLRSTDPDVVVAFGDMTNIAVIHALLGTGVPVVASEQVDPRLPLLSRRWRWLRTATYPLAAAVIVQTEAVARWAAGRRPRWRVRVAPNAVAPIPDAVPPHRPAWFGSVGNLVAMGRLAPQKGFDLLLPAFAGVAGQHPGWHLTVLGEGAGRADLEARAVDLGIADRVTFAGLVSPPWPVLRGADAFVLSSRYEGFPNALLEAMACGLPVVAFDCPTGPSDIVRHAVDGLLVTPGDVLALGRALDRMMGDDEARMIMAARAWDVRERFGVPTVMPRWAAVLDEAAGRRPTGVRDAL